MTALNAAILFNNSTGSDTTSSGSSAGANVYGSGASTTSASAVVTGITTTGVQAGDLLWVQSSSGRQFSVIASVDSGTQVTCDDTFANTESSRTWAIGGKRATLDNADSRSLLEADAKSGFVFEIEHTGTNYLLSSTLDLTLNVSYLTVEGSGSTSPTIEATFNGNAIEFRNYRRFRNLNFINSNATKTASRALYGVAVSNVNGFLDNVTVGDLTNYFWKGVDGSSTAYHLYRVGVQHCVSDGGTFPRHVFANQCNFSNNGGYGFYASGNGQDSHLYNSVITNNSSGGYRSHLSRINIMNCIFHGNTGNGASQTGPYGPTYINIENNIFSGGTYGIAPNANLSNRIDYLIKHNAFYNQSSGQVNNIDNLDPITLTADPFVDAANGDLNISDSAGGGATLRANNFALNTDTAVYPFRQYVSDDFGGGGGNVIVIED